MIRARILVVASLLALAAVVVTAEERRSYPTAPAGTVVDNYHGTEVPDPYRWLEDSESAATKSWLREEAALTTRELAALPGQERIRTRLSALMSNRRPGIPWREAGRIYWTEARDGDNQPVLFATDRPGGEGRVVFNPNLISPDGSVAMSDFIVSPDGMLLAYLAAKGGADAGEIRIRDLGAGRDRPDVIHGYNACWTRDGRGFFYAQRFASENDAKKRGGVRAWYHRLGDSPSSDRMLVSWDADASWVYFMTSEDGRYAAMVAEKGLVDQIFILDLGDSSAKPFEILAGLGTNHTPLDWVGDTFFVRTKHNAPRTRVIALDLREGTAAKPRAIVPESTDVIADAIITDERLVIHYLSDVHGVLRVFSLDGTLEGEIALPGIGRVGWPLSARPSTPELFFSFESFLSPAAVYTCDVSARAATVYRTAATTPDASRYETTQVFYPARDGTRVPMFITAAKGLALDGTHPVFLTGYGGYGATVQPSYSAEVPLWLEMGGVYVLANIRGGGEYGEEWHRAGMLEHKQTSFNDFIAAAEYLVEKGYTTRGRIAIHGHSNGGLLMGAVLTQRPDLWGAVVANAGHYDMLRYHRFTAGASWVSEYGSADNAAQFAYLRAYSPLQNVKAGTCYPPTLLLVAAQDDRVVPLHGYKFAAALQAAQSCDAPILLRVAENSSHSYSSSQELVAERADMWSFIAAKLGVSP